MTLTPSNIKSKNLLDSEPEENCSWKNCWYPITFLQDFPNNRPYGFTLHDEPFVLLKNTEGKFICYLLSLYKDKKITHSVSVKSFPVARKHFLDTKLFELEQKYISDDYKSIFLPSGVDKKLHIALESDKVHVWRLNDGTSVILLHQFDNTMSGVIRFPRDNNRVATLKSEKEVLEFFQHNFPEVGQLMPKSEAAAFLNRPIATTLTIRCSHYHYADSVLLIGDAAHAVSPALGQGCNSALEDVAVLNQLLDEYADDLVLALEQFTIRRLADAHAVVELSDSTFSSSKSLFIEFIVRQRLAKILYRFFPRRFFPPLFEALYDSSISYAEILQVYKNWCEKVKKSQTEFL